MRMRLCWSSNCAYIAPSRRSRRVEPSISVKTKVTVPAGSASPNIGVGISAASRQPELQLDVVRISKHNHRPDRCLRDRRVLDSGIDNSRSHSSGAARSSTLNAKWSRPVGNSSKQSPSRLWNWSTPRTHPDSESASTPVLDRLVIAGQQHRQPQQSAVPLGTPISVRHRQGNVMTTSNRRHSALLYEASAGRMIALQRRTSSAATRTTLV